MPAHAPHRAVLALVLAAGLALSAAGCAPDPGPALPPANAASTPPVPPQGPSASPDPVETGAPVAPVDVSCDELIGPDLVSELTDQGWTAREDPFVIGDLELPDGVACTWGDFSGESTGDDLLLFGWSPISADDAAAAQATLEAEGWILEEGTDGLYVTENPAEAIALDEDGYGMTYLFGNGWVTVSDTKQGLVLIQRPAS